MATARLSFGRGEEGSWSVAPIGGNLPGENYFHNEDCVSGNFQIKGNPAPGSECGLSFHKNF